MRHSYKNIKIGVKSFVYSIPFRVSKEEAQGKQRKDGATPFFQLSILST
jgi:hypothetical protein